LHNATGLGSVCPRCRRTPCHQQVPSPSVCNDVIASPPTISPTLVTVAAWRPRIVLVTVNRRPSSEDNGRRVEPIKSQSSTPFSPTQRQMMPRARGQL
ncbi:hypothetical protein NDU88_004453, partial [Pleurodeles waltl]